MIKNKQTIFQNSEIELEIKHSRFLGFSFVIFSPAQAEEIIKQIKQEHPRATHVCYGYVLQNSKKADDNGEPSGTAGLPILSVIEKQALSNVLVIVVRYFGGIKLGAGGLVRAYAKTAKQVLDNSGVATLVPCTTYELVADYETYANQIEPMFCEELVLQQVQYLQQVVATIKVAKQKEDEFLSKTNNLGIKLQQLEDKDYIILKQK